MAYPVMYLVRDTQGETLFKSNDKEEAIKWAKRLDKMRTAVAGTQVNPLCLVQSQFIGWIDEL
jgi:hypothetical protein